jgi:hypothetical protein
MGGRSWWYLTDYDADATAALSTLRARVFKEGEYFFEGVPQQSIAALLDAAGEGGTSSILDIEAAAPTADAGVAAPASWRLLQAAFGTARPSLDQVRQETLRLAGMLPLWRCAFFPVYEGEVAVKWCFAGTSGETSEVRSTLRRAAAVRTTFRAPLPVAGPVPSAPPRPTAPRLPVPPGLRTRVAVAV